MGLFKGRRTPQGCVVTHCGNKLNPRHNIRNHSPDGFEWGYGGSGPAQLALAILVKVAGKVTAVKLYQEFKRKVIAAIKEDSWEMDSAVVKEWVTDALLAASANDRDLTDVAADIVRRVEERP